MDFFEKLNKKLDLGFKLTDHSCPICKKSVLYNPEDKSLYCVGCNLPVKFEGDIIDSADQQEEKQQIKQNNSSEKSNSEFELIQKAERQSQKTDQGSKLLSQKLLQGWAMLEESCGVCYLPIMRSKNGEHICVECKWSKMVDPKSGKSLTDVLREEKSIQDQKALESKFENDLKIEQEEIKQKNPVKEQKQKVQEEKKPAQKKSKKSQKKVEQIIESSSESDSDFAEEQEQGELKDIIKGSLCKIAKFYDRQVEFCIRNNQVSQIEHMVNNNFKNLIELQKSLKK